MKNWWLFCGGLVLIVMIGIGAYQYSQTKVINDWSDGKQNEPSVSPSIVVNEKLPTVDTKQKLNDYFLRILKEEKKSRGWFSTKESLRGGTSTNESMAMSDTAKTGINTNQNYSKTNNQVEGVDEADIVKTDGSYLYQVMNGKVIISKVIPADQMKMMKTISYKQPLFSPSQLFIYKDQMVVIGHSYPTLKSDRKMSSTRSMIAPMNQSMKAIVYNISDRSEPRMIREIEIEGSHVSARRINEFVYLVSNTHPNYWILEQNKDIDLRPKVSDSAVSDQTKPINFEDIHYFPHSRENNYTIITTFNLEKPKEDATFTTYLGSGRDMYMSAENLYLAVTSYKDIPKDPRKNFSPNTSIYKFAIDKEKVTFKSSAEIPGTVLNQFSMDEHEGNFRVVTTKGQTWNEKKPSDNNLYILDENLKTIGKIEGLAEGERIYSARFMKDRIYVVTFKEVDPLFVIDASTPDNPKVLGKLKIPGFSNYLHPYDENHVIGFGHDAKVDTGNDLSIGPRVLTQGVKISLFDVSDVKNPKEKFTKVIGGRGTYSPLSHNHKALLIHKNRDLYAFPISVYDDIKGDEQDQNFVFQGAMVFNIDLKEGITLRKKISHIDGKNPYEEQNGEIKRLIYARENLYAISPTMITAHDINNLKKVGELALNVRKAQAPCLATKVTGRPTRRLEPNSVWSCVGIHMM
ncbi:beta-propeller domain-containing protein [Pseudalkalibacillus decolorationis]|uniref:beta-propeller domain-containing protein n=1 Tax=Pseudalkalibacillus decolorationis TaxID=163879 RepID=UPI0021497CAC|nr:beta-propeller domain-containing protein [Pseudalkalibacillus decolorationis]